MNRHILSMLIVTVEFCASNAVLTESASVTNMSKVVERTEAWLVSQQAANGAWEPVKQVAITAMALSGYEGAGHVSGSTASPTVTKGYEYLLHHLQPDGGFYAGTNYQNYNTSWSLIALTRRHSAADQAVIQKARALIVSWQMDLNAKGKQDHLLDGGFGYGDGTPRANLANTLAPLSALYATRSFAAPNEPKLNRAALLDFLHCTQHFSKVNLEPSVCEDNENRGGFMYHPDKSFAGEVKLASRESEFRSQSLDL